MGSSTIRLSFREGTLHGKIRGCDQDKSYQCKKGNSGNWFRHVHSLSIYLPVESDTIYPNYDYFKLYPSLSELQLEDINVHVIADDAIPGGDQGDFER
jgi:hypothetical protein